MSGRLEGKVAIVTGGGGGFGKGIAERYVKEGAKVLIVDMNEELGQKTASEIKCEFAKGNVTERKSWEDILKTVAEKFGKLDIVVNNAGTTYRNKVRLHVFQASYTGTDPCCSLLRMSQTKISTRSSSSTSSRYTTPRTYSYLT